MADILQKLFSPMSGNQNQQEGDNLARDFNQKANIGSGNKGYNFQPGQSFQPGQAFVPGQQFTPQYNQYGQYGQYGGYSSNNNNNNNNNNNQYSQYGGGYNQYGGGYNNNYNQYGGGRYGGGYQAEPEPEEEKSMTLAEYQAAQKAKLSVAPRKKLVNTTGISIGSGSKTIKVGGSATTTPAKKDETKVEAKKDEPKVETKKEEPKVETKKEEPKAEAKKEEPKKETKKTAATKDATSAETADPVAESHVDKEVLDDMFGNAKEHMSIMFMGHVDAGKSTMGGNILYLTGAVDKRTVEKYERDAKDAGRQGWYLSWVMDTNKEERDQGKTVEVGRAFFETEKRRYTILDAPGHKMYVPSMIQGASQADVGILVISARKGEYETGFEKGGQTREHALLAKTQGINRLVVVVNKMDDPTVEWSESRYNECITKLGQYLKANGYNLKTDVIFMPVSGYTGAGLKDRIASDVCPWYNGPSLLEYLDGIKLDDRKLNAPFMLPISGKTKDLGTVVEGKIESGSVRKGQSLLLMPNKNSVEVTAVYNETEAEVNGAMSGEQVRIKLRGVEEEDVQMGFVLTSAQNPVQTTTEIEAQIAIVEIKSIMTAGFSCVMHIHTAVEEVTFTQLRYKFDKATGKRIKKPPFAKRGDKIIARLKIAEPLCAEPYEDHPQLGRFTLRDQGQTIAIGKITKIIA